MSECHQLGLEATTNIIFFVLLKRNTNVPLVGHYGKK